MKSKRFKIILILGFIAAISAFFIYDYTFNSEHRDIASEEATVTIDAQALQAQFMDNEQEATVQYLDKVIAASGVITTIETEEIILNDKVSVGLENKEISGLKVGAALTVKGRCLGYDELLEMVKIDQATIINK